MGFPGTWMTTSESVVYRVVPKCACSTIGQIMYYSDHGEFFDGDIHDAQAGMHKWAMEDSQPKITDNVKNHSSYSFTCVRNPYTRILSSFFDKICGIQRNGKRYRGNLVPLLIQKYGIEVGSPEDGFEFDQVKSFRRFLLFARDTIRWRRPMDPDIHWSAMSGHISTFIVNGGRYDNIFWTEQFNDGMQSVLDAIETPVGVSLKSTRKISTCSNTTSRTQAIKCPSERSIWTKCMRNSGSDLRSAPAAGGCEFLGKIRDTWWESVKPRLACSL